MKNPGFLRYSGRRLVNFWASEATAWTRRLRSVSPGVDAGGGLAAGLVDDPVGVGLGVGDRLAALDLGGEDGVEIVLHLAGFAG